MEKVSNGDSVHKTKDILLEGLMFILKTCLPFDTEVPCLLLKNDTSQNYLFAI